MPKKVTWSGKKKRIVYEMPDLLILQKLANSDEDHSPVQREKEMEEEQSETLCDFKNIQSTFQAYMNYVERSGKNSET